MAGITKIMHGPLFSSSVFISVCVFSVWPKTTLLLVWPRDAKRMDTPGVEEEVTGSCAEGSDCGGLAERALQTGSEESIR